MPVSFKVIKKPIPPTRQINIVRQEVLKTTQPVMKRYVGRKHEATGRFTHKPQYESRIYVRATAITFTVLLKNAGMRVGNVTLGTLLKWLYVTGTKAHLIRAKAGKFLAFASGNYSRKTEGGGGLSGGGATGFRRAVRHPGFAPSKRMEKIDKEFEPIFLKALRGGTEIGLRKAKK